MQNTDRLLFDLRNLQYDYADCKGNHGLVLSKFTQILNRYQKNYYMWEPLSKEDLDEPEPKYSLISELKLIAIIAAVFILSALILQNNFLSVVVYIAAGAIFTVRRDNIGWAILIIALTLSFMIAGKLFMDGSSTISTVIFAIALALYLFSAVIRHFSAVGVKEKHKANINETISKLDKIEKELVRDQKIMNEMLPSLISEFKCKQREFAERSGDAVDEDVLALCSEMPVMFWWQILPWDLKKYEDSFTEQKNDNVAWETRWVNRSKGNEFPDAGSEYSPLMEITDSSEEYKRLYDEVKKEFFEDSSAGVFDFISRGTTTSMDEEFFQYEEYAHSDFYRTSKEMLWASVGYDIDDARRKGQITAEQYSSLCAAYYVAGSDVYSDINAKVEKTGMKYRPVKSSTNIWVGQMLLADDDKGDGIVVVDYRCQIPHIFKNIDELHNVRITRVSGDPVNRNPMVMAKFHKVCELCR